MDMDLTEFQEVANRVLTDMGLPADEEKSWAQAAELGWLLVQVPEELGGLGAGLDAACLFHTELGRALSGAPYIPAMVTLEAVAASEIEGKQDLLEQLSAGGYAACALTKPDVFVSSDAVSGVFGMVQSADLASHFLVPAPDGSAVYLIAADAPGVEIVATKTWDVTRRFFDVKLDKATGLILAEGDAADAIIQKMDTHLDFALAADSVGGAETIFEMTVEYLKTRQQYRRPLAMFQALKHRAADLKSITVAAKALLDDMLSGADSSLPISVAAQMAKSVACTNYMSVAEESVQLHGGIAMTEEYPCHLFLKRAMLNQKLGSNERTADLAIAQSFLAAAE